MNGPAPTNIITKKYDSGLDFHVTMYDNLPYQRDSDYCNIQKLTLNSASLIKYYLCINHQESHPIDNQDSVIEEKLQQLRLEYANRIPKNQIKVEPVMDSDEITAEQIRNLLNDNDSAQNSDFESEAVQTESDAPVNSTNPFADVEDW